MRGIFFVLYGPNNLGKSTQLDLLEKTWQEMGREYRRIKYPIYDSPSGEVINLALRGSDSERASFSEVDLQLLFAENRREYEAELVEMLESGIDVLAEDYVGTGLAWGLTRGVDRGVLNEYNRGLLVPDVAVLLDGCRFSSGIEKCHRNEASENGVWERNREIHLELASEMNWEIVDANQTKEKVNQEILERIARKGFWA